MKSKAVVTGCSGFVGRVLVQLLVDKGFEVWGVDRAPKREEFPGKKRLVGDLTAKADVENILEKAGADYVFHLAAQSSVRKSFDDPFETILNNTLPTLHILDFMRQKPVTSRMLAVGSADEYGNVSESSLPIREDHAVNPVSPYALGKSIQSQYCQGYAALYGLDIVTTRSFNHTGAGQRDTFVLPSFAKQLVEIRLERRDPVIEVGNLDVRRDFLDVRDVCAAYLALLRKGERGGIYNVCSGQSHRLGDLLDKLIEMSGVEVEIRVDPDRLRAADVPELRGDPTRIMNDTGWKPEHSIEDMLASLLDYWERGFAAPGAESAG